MSTQEQLGKRKKELNKALSDAFIKKTHLQQMLDYELDIRLEDIVNIDNAIQDIVFEITNWFEKEGKIFELIEASFNHNPGNSKLQHFIAQNFDYIIEGVIQENFPIAYEELKSLIYILKEIKNFELFKDCLKSSLPEYFNDDYEKILKELEKSKVPIDAQIFGMIKIIKEHKYYDGEKTLSIIKFTVNLKNKIKNPSHNKKLQEWLRKQKEAGLQVPELLISHVGQELQPYLMVILQPSSLKNHVSIFAYLALGDNNVYDDKNIISLSDDYDSFKFNKQEIGKKITNYIDSSQKEIERRKGDGYKIRANLTIEIFLPYNYIFTPIHQWMITPPSVNSKKNNKVKISSRHRVTARAWERLCKHKSEWRNNLDDSWNKIRTKNNSQDISIFKSFNIQKEKPNSLSQLLRENENIVCLSLTAVSYNNKELETWIDLIYGKGIPVILWTSPCHLENISDEIDKKFSNIDYLDLPELLDKVRNEWESASDETHLGYHLGVLYDEPYRLRYLANKVDNLGLGA